jgi:hypothetical protein
MPFGATQSQLAQFVAGTPGHPGEAATEPMTAKMDMAASFIVAVWNLQIST